VKKMAKEKKKKHYFAKFAIFVLFIISAIILYGRFEGIKGLEVREYSVINSKIPTSFNGLKIVQFSDFHYNKLADKDILVNVIKKINELKPDIVVFTGDLIDYNYKLKDDEKNDIIKILSKLNPLIATYAVKGNEDQNDSYISILSGAKIKLLNNTNELVYYKGNNPIMFVGLDSYLEGNIDITNAFNYDQNSNYYTILLAHEPDVFTKIKDKKIDLMLAGHSHNGQVRLPFIGAIYKPVGAKTYYDPLYKINDTYLYISGGIGTSIYPIRICDKPSINFYRLYTK
jgi:uncharacterized protein